MFLQTARFLTAFVATIAFFTVHSPVSAECTSFAFNSHGVPFFAANYDFPDQLEDGLIFVNPRNTLKRGWTANIADGYEPDPKSERVSWTSQYGSVTFNLVGYGLVWGGMNEEGLCVSTMYLPETKVPEANARPRLHGAAWLQFMLDTCASTEDVATAIDRFAVETVDHYHFCDRSGKSLIVEFIDGKCISKWGTTNQTRALTNSTFSQSQRAAADPTAIGSDDPFDSLKRYCTVTACLKRFRNRKSGNPIDFAFDTLKAAKNPSTTQWSIAFDIGGRKLHFTTSSHPERKSIDVARIDFSRANRVKMFPVQTTAMGDLTTSFYPYRHLDAFNHTIAFITGYIAYKDLPELPDPESWVRRLVKHLEADIEVP